MKLKTKFKLAALTAVVSATFATSAWSANLPFTLTPSAAAPSLTTNPGTLTADTLVGSDNALITITNTGAGYTQSETGVIQYNSALLSGSPLLSGALAGLNAGPVGSTATWGLYALFTTTSPLSPTFLTANIPVTLSYSLWGDRLSNTTFSTAGAITGGSGNDVLLASGVAAGTATIGPSPFNPTIAVAGSFNVAPGEGSGPGTFFTSPNPFYISIGASATSFGLGTVSSTCPPGGPASGLSCTIRITGGGATSGFAGTVPEPETVALLGLGLLGLGFTQRKQSRSSAA